MKDIHVILEGDAPKSLSYALSFYGSLNVGRDLWARLLGKFGWETPYVYLHEYLESPGDNPAKDIVAENYDENYPAHYEYCEGGVTFSTPSSFTDVCIEVNENNQVVVDVFFNRDSHHAATCLLARFVEMGDMWALPQLVVAAKEYDEWINHRQPIEHDCIEYGEQVEIRRKKHITFKYT